MFVWYPSIFNEKPLRYLDFVHFSDASFARFQSLQRRCCIIRFFLTCSLSVFTTESAELTEARNARFYLFSLRALCSLWLLIVLYPVTYRTAELCNNAVHGGNPTLVRAPVFPSKDVRWNVALSLLVNWYVPIDGVGNSKIWSDMLLLKLKVVVELPFAVITAEPIVRPVRSVPEAIMVLPSTVQLPVLDRYVVKAIA